MLCVAFREEHAVVWLLIVALRVCRNDGAGVSYNGQSGECEASLPVCHGQSTGQAGGPAASRHRDEGKLCR